MKNLSAILKNSLITLLFLFLAFLLSLVFQNHFQIREPITALFIFAVFLISLLTDGYLYGLTAAFLGTIAVNYAFTFPYFALNFTIPVNLVSGMIMITIAVLTSTLTTKVKRHEAEKAEGDKERMRANLLRSVSHDLRTPLTTIYGSSSALLENRGILSEEQEVSMIRSIQEDAEWLVRMVENLLSITRIDSGRVKITMSPIILEELIDSAIVKFRKRYPNQSVLLTLPEEMIIIPMDAILIEQVLINLLDNAVQHARGMTELALRVTHSDRLVVFEVRDNGCGIRQELVDGKFQSYFAPKNEPVDSQKRNAGIGLSVCDSIIKAHGGNFWADNLPSGGAAFCFSLNTEEISLEQQ